MVQYFGKTFSKFYEYTLGALLLLLFSAHTFGNESGNLLSNGGFDDASGWTVVSQYGIDVDGNGVVTIENGTATFSETVAGSWTKHMGIYTSVQLDPGIYQFDMDMDYADINELWGEVYIGKSEPQANSEYSGDQQVIKAYNSWDCSSIITYSGKASESGCDSSANPGQFTISESGVYYLLFRSGANTYGSKGVILDNWTLFNVSDTFAPIISLKGAETVSVYLNSIYTDLGAITDSGEEVEIDSSAVDTSKAGTYIVTYNAADSENNQATQITRTVNVESSYLESASLLTNGSFDDSTGWTVVNQYGPDVDGNGVVTINDGKVTFSETVSGPWSKHMGIYTSAQLASGIYQFDMQMDYASIEELWGEVYVGKDEPQANSEYFGDQRVLRAYDTSSCPSVTTYSGKAILTGCDSAATPGQFVISEPGTYYLLFRTGANTYGTEGIILDDWTVSKVIAGEDNVAPIISLVGGDSISIYLNSTYDDLGATSDTGEEVVVDSSAVDTSKIGSYIVTYDVTDASDNVATQITRTVNVIEPGTAVVADFSEAFGGAIYDASTDTFTWPANSEGWAGFANQNTALYPFRFPNGGELTFTGAVPSGGGDVSVRFKFERLPHPDVEPAFDTSSVTITGEAESSYSITIPAQDAANTYRSLIFYLNDQNSAVVIKNVRVTSAEGGSVTEGSAGDASDSESSRFAIWMPFDGTTKDENTYMWPTSAQNWAGFENTNTSIIPMTFAAGGSVSFTGSTPSGGEDVSVGFTFERQTWPNADPQFDSEKVTVSGESEKTYTINIPARPSDETYSSLLLKILDRDRSVIIKDVQFNSNDDLELNGEAGSSTEEAAHVSGIVYHWKNQTLLNQVSVGISSSANSTVTQQSVSNNLGEFDLAVTQQGSNKLIATKPVSGSESGSVISSADALAALKIAVGINPNQDPDGPGPSTVPPVSPYQYIAADITGDGRVTSADALAILKMAVNLETAEPRRWAFVAENYNFWDESANSGRGGFKTNSSSVIWDSGGASFTFPQEDNVNIVGILLGDVNGSWSAPDGSSTLSNEHFVNLVDNQGGSLAQWGLSDSNNSESGSSDSGIVKIEAEDYTNTDLDVAKETTSDDGAGQNVGYIDAGEILEYSFNVPASGNYTASYRVASNGGSLPGIRLLINDIWVDEVAIPNTGDWQAFQTVTGRVLTLPAGTHTAKIEAKSGRFNINWFSFTPTTDDAAVAPSEPVIENSLVASDLVGYWTYTAGGPPLGVGPAEGSFEYFFLDEAEETTRACLMDDLFMFGSDGSFSNILGETTWVEDWQGGNNACAAPVSPHDGSTSATYAFADAAPHNTIILSGVGAYLGLPKPNNNGELSSPTAAPSQITYEISASTATTMTLQINYSGDNYWTYNLSKTTAPADVTAPVITLTGDATVSVNQNEPYIDPGATADSGETVVVDASAVDTTTVGSYMVTYNVTDEAGNAATQVTRTVNVVAVAQEITIYVRDIGFSSPYYLFSDTANGASKTLTLQRGSTYKFIADGVGSNHPFNIGSGWSQADPEIILSSTSSSGRVGGVGSIITGQTMTLTVPLDYQGNSITYYCYRHPSMVSSFAVVDP